MAFTHKTIYILTQEGTNHVGTTDDISSAISIAEGWVDQDPNKIPVNISTVIQVSEV